VSSKLKKKGTISNTLCRNRYHDGNGEQKKKFDFETGESSP